MKISEKEAEEMVRKADKFLFKERVKRTKFLESITREIQTTPVDSIAYEYLHESCFCWLSGTFVSTIIMMQAAMETQLRQSFNLFLMFKGQEDMQEKANKMNFFNLIELSKNTKMITAEESKKLHSLRKLRNPFVHVSNPKDGKETENSARKISEKLNERVALMENMTHVSRLEHDAKKVIRLFPLFWEISKKIDVEGFVKQFTDESKYNVHYFPNKETIMKKFD